MSHRILVVDDEESIRFTFAEFLGNAGYVVDSAANLEQAVAHFENREYDAIFLDILLGRESGINVLQVARQTHPNCPVTMITGAPDAKTAADAVRLGAFDYLAKPITQSELIRQAQRAIAYKTALAEKIRYQKRMSAIFQGVKEGILVFDADLTLIDVNFAALKMVRCSQDVLGKDLESIIRETSNPVLKALQGLLESRFDGELYDLTVTVASGDQVALGVSVASLTSDKGLDADLVLVLRDHRNQAMAIEAAG